MSERLEIFDLVFIFPVIESEETIKTISKNEDKKDFSQKCYDSVKKETNDMLQIEFHINRYMSSYFNILVFSKILWHKHSIKNLIFKPSDNHSFGLEGRWLLFPFCELQLINKSLNIKQISTNQVILIKQNVFECIMENWSFYPCDNNSKLIQFEMETSLTFEQSALVITIRFYKIKKNNQGTGKIQCVCLQNKNKRTHKAYCEFAWFFFTDFLCCLYRRCECFKREKQ